MAKASATELKEGDRVRIVGAAWNIQQGALAYCDDVAVVRNVYEASAHSLNVEVRTRFGSRYLARPNQLRKLKSPALSSWKEVNAADALKSDAKPAKGKSK